MFTPRPKKIRRASAVLAAAVAAIPLIAASSANADVTGGSGQVYLIQTTGATALNEFTSATGNRGTYLLGQESLRIGGTTYTIGQFGQAIGQQQFGNPALIEPPNSADRILYSYHQTGSVNGLLDLAIRNGLLNATPRAVNDGNPLFIMGTRNNTFPASNANGYTGFYDGTLRNAPVPGVPGAFYDHTVSQKPIPQVAYSDVRFEQGFSRAGTAAVDARPTALGYGKGQNPALRNFNSGSPNFQRLADGDTSLVGGIEPGTTLLRNTQLAAVPFTVSASPGTGLDSITREDYRFLQTSGRLQNGANFHSVTRDIGSGTRNQAGNNANIDPSWAHGERDRVALGTFTTDDVDGNIVTVRPGDEAKPAFNRVTGANQINFNENRPSLFATFGDKTSGTSGVRPTVFSQRMALGVLSVGDVVDRGQLYGTNTQTNNPLRILAIDWDGTDNVFGQKVGPVQPTLDAVTEGTYKLWSAAVGVTVRGTLANGADADGRLTGGQYNPNLDSVYNDVDDDGSGTGIVSKFLQNIVGDATLTAFRDADGNPILNAEAITPLDGIITAGFVPLPLMQVGKEFDGDTQTVIPRNNPALQNVYNQVGGTGVLGRNLTYVRAGDHNGNIAQQAYRIFDVDTSPNANSTSGDVVIPYTARTFLAGDVDGDGVRDLGDTEAWAQAFATTSAFLAANPSITAGGPVSVSGNLDTAGLTAQHFGLIALTDLNGDGNVVARNATGDVAKFLPNGQINPTWVAAAGRNEGTRDRVAAVSRDDVEFFLYGAAIDTTGPNANTGYAGSTNVQTRRELGVRLGQLRKNEAVDRFNAEIDRLGAASSFKFDRFDVNGDGQLTRADFDYVNRNVGKNYTNLADVLSTSDDLIRAELTDTNRITHIDGLGTPNLQPVLNPASPTYRQQLAAQSDTRQIVGELTRRGVITPGDINLSGTTTLGDVTTALSSRTLPAGTARFQNGDVSFTGTVTLGDVNFILANRTQPILPVGSNVGTNTQPGENMSLASIAAVSAALLSYNPDTGNVVIKPNGNRIGAFTLTNAPGGLSFFPDNFNTPPGGFGGGFVLTEKLPDELSYLDQLITNTNFWAEGGFDSDFDMGNVFPTSLSLDDLNTFLTRLDYLVALSATASPAFPFALEVIPEPGTVGLLGVVATLMLTRRRRAA